MTTDEIPLHPNFSVPIPPIGSLVIARGYKGRVLRVDPRYGTVFVFCTDDVTRVFAPSELRKIKGNPMTIRVYDLIHVLETFPPNSLLKPAMRGDVIALAVLDPSGAKLLAHIDNAETDPVEPVRVTKYP